MAYRALRKAHAQFLGVPWEPDRCQGTDELEQTVGVWKGATIPHHYTTTPRHYTPHNGGPIAGVQILGRYAKGLGAGVVFTVALDGQGTVIVQCCSVMCSCIFCIPLQRSLLRAEFRGEGAAGLRHPSGGKDSRVLGHPAQHLPGGVWCACVWSLVVGCVAFDKDALRR